MKVFKAQYKVKFGSMTVMRKHIGTVRESFDCWLAVARKKCKDEGRLNARLTDSASSQLFDEEKSKVTHKRKAECMLAEPEDQIWDVETYEEENGDPATNGLGHTKGTFEGIFGVLVPAKKIWKIQRRKGVEAAIDTTIDDGENTLEDGQQENNFKQLADAMKTPSIVGVSLDPTARSSSEAYRGARVRAKRTDDNDEGSERGE